MAIGKIVWYIDESTWHQEQSFNDTYTALILEESEKLYNQIITELTNGVIATAEASRASSLPP
jgi:hypothetical protein